MTSNSSSSTDVEPNVLDVIVIGAGFAGLDMAYRLSRDGNRRFTVLEQAASLGGTWRDNVYPGCACDVPAQLYSFSWAPNPDWSRYYAGQAEIRAYLERTADDFGLRPFIRFSHVVTALAYDQHSRIWTVSLRDRPALQARHVVLATGPLNIPAYPNIPGLDGFKGRTLHSAQWDPAYDPTGQHVAVIGTGASAIQFVPEVAKRAASVTVFQRTPPWVVPRPDRSISDGEKRAYRRWPWLQRLVRARIYWEFETRALGFVHAPRLLAFMQWRAKRNMAKAIRDPKLRQALTPDYKLGCKRILVSDDYYPALARDHVSLNTAGIDHIDGNGVVDQAGQHHRADSILFGTGFKVQETFNRFPILGEGGRSLEADWQDYPKTHLGITVAGYPNLFILFGPNAGLGHNSIIYMIESQTAFVMDALRQMQARGATALKVTEAAQDRFDHLVQSRLAGSVWQVGGCQSWYQNEEGRNIALWPGFTFRYRQLTKKLNPADYVFET